MTSAPASRRVGIPVLLAAALLLGPAEARAQSFGVRVGSRLDGASGGGLLGAYYRLDSETWWRIEGSIDACRTTLDAVEVTGVPLRVSAHAYLQRARFQGYVLAGVGVLPGRLEAAGGRSETFVKPEILAGAGAGVGFGQLFFLALEVRRSWADERVDDRTLELGGTWAAITLGATMDFTH